MTANVGYDPVMPPLRSLVTGVSALALAPVAFGVGSYDSGTVKLIAPDVRIAAVEVSGMTASAARREVTARHIVPRFRRLELRFHGKNFSIEPRAAGYTVDLDRAISRALAVGRTAPLVPTDIRLVERVSRAKLAERVRAKAKEFRVAPVDARVTLAGSGRPRVTPFRFGYEINEAAAVERIAQGLVVRKLRRYPLPERRIAPGTRSIGSVVVVDRARFLLTLYRGDKPLRKYGVAVGLRAYPTPAGAFRIVVRQTNPTWFPPSSPWAKGLGPVPPGPGNPLGTRWMGTSSSGIGIHGTPAGWSIGSRASHGCIRMRIPDAESLYSRVSVGTPVFIR